MLDWKALKYGKNETRGLICGSTSSICQDALKSINLLHKFGFVDSQMVGAVGTKVYCKTLSTILPTLQIFQLYSVQLLAVLCVPQ